MQIISQHRSMGLKLALLGAIVFLLGIPLGLVNLLSWEREGRASEAVSGISEIYGGEQVLRGPFLVVPYTVHETVWEQEGSRRVSRENVRQDHVFVSAGALAYEVNQSVEMRHRGIYDVPVYSALIDASGQIEVPDLSSLMPQGSTPDYDNAGIVLAVSDLRGISDALDLRIAGRSTPLAFEPGTSFDHIGWRGVRAPLGRVEPGQRLDMTAHLRMSGAAALRFTASARETSVRIQSDWPHPGFDGGFLPVSRDIQTTGYTAEWRVPYLARGVPASWLQRDGGGFALDGQAFGVELVAPANSYQQVSRSLKYAMFFIGFLMVMLFLIESRSGKRIHPAQYVLAGMAQVVFYLLLLAFSEHVGVGAAYGLAALATVGLTGFYAMTAFSSRRLGLVTFVAMCVVYAMQYALILLEDYALLIGAVLAFAGLAGTMVLTRRIDWYATTASSPPVA